MKRWINLRRLAVLVTALVLCCAAAFSAAAQEQSTLPVTDDQVNAIAKKLYCPVCENITLDTCGTAACADWRYEIRLQLEQGKTEQEIVDEFVNRFGDRVVGTPQDVVLRALSLVTPWVIIGGLLLLLGWMLFSRQRKPAAAVTTAPAGASAGASSAQQYQDLIERDLEG
ncbi:MAG: cytochrome c-type biogenesis protein CcmH [Anaerolineae bacterium]|nr:cytochrome c-type biogenesis protein CcmH [Anaerolineae bacterium]